MLGRVASEGAVAGTALNALNEYTPPRHVVHMVQTGSGRPEVGGGMCCNLAYLTEGHQSGQHCRHALQQQSASA